MTPGDAEITVENNSSPQLQVQVQDKAGNVTVHPRLNVVCKVKIKSVAGQKDHVMNPNEVLCVVRLKGQTDF